MFEVGQKVVCVDAKNRGGRLWGKGCAPVEGEVYTVRSFGVTKYYKVQGIRLVEKINNQWAYGEFYRDSCFRASRFRPLTDTELSELRKATIKKHFGHHLRVPERV